MTTPHAVIEGMLRAVDDHGGHEQLAQHVDMRVWPDVLRALGRAVHFELGEARPTEAHEEFAFDLFERDMFKLPFPITFWTGQSSPNTAFLISEDDPVSWRPSGKDAGGERGVGLILIGQMLDRKGRDGRQWYVPLVSGRVSHTPLDADGPIRFSWRSLTDGAKSRKTGEDWTEDRFAAAVDKASRLIFGSTVMLMTPDVEQRVEPAPAKLNVHREKKGKPPIGERRVIIIKPYAREALSGTDAAKAFNDRRGPRPHMRRGHFRTLMRGSEAERVIPVAPCVVGVSDEARESIKPKQYTVKSQGASQA